MKDRAPGRGGILMIVYLKLKVIACVCVCVKLGDMGFDIRLGFVLMVVLDGRWGMRRRAVSPTRGSGFMR